MDQWQEYLTEWDDYDFTHFDEDGYSQRLHELAEDIFQEDPSAVLVNLIDVCRELVQQRYRSKSTIANIAQGDPENIVVRSLDTEEKVETQLFQGNRPARRIMSVPLLLYLSLF